MSKEVIEQKYKSIIARNTGEEQGFLEGILHWDIPDELKVIVQRRVDELKERTKKLIT